VFTVVLKPGDALYIPSFWWHHVKSVADPHVSAHGGEPPGAGGGGGGGGEEGEGGGGGGGGEGEMREEVPHAASAESSSAVQTPTSSKQQQQTPRTIAINFWYLNHHAVFERLMNVWEEPGLS
jgi:hypothetical protein